MSFSITPRVLCVLSLAVASVAGQWSGNYNTTRVERDVPLAKKCLIDSLDPTRGPATVIYPCTCTGGKVLPDCNWRDFTVLNRVRDAKCKCATTKVRDSEPESLQAYGRDSPEAVTKCVCDPPACKGDDSTDELVVPAPNCWCPAASLRKKSGLSEAEATPAVPETPATGSIQQCRDDLNRSWYVQKNLCKQLEAEKPKEFSEPMQRALPHCSISSLTEVCKGISQD